MIARLSGDRPRGILSTCEPGGRSLQFLIILIKQCYSPEVTAPIRRKITRWIFDHLLWDTTSTVRQGFWGGLWATRKLLVAFAGAALLTWREWAEHKPPEIAIVALIHFVFVLAAIALLLYTGQWFSHSDKNPPSKQAKRPYSE
jgi:hypothetical protein